MRCAGAYDKRQRRVGIMKNRGFTLIELMIVISIIGILALIAIPNFSSVRQRAYSASAQSASYNGKIAEEMNFQNTGGSLGGTYATNLVTLTPWDKNLNKDPMVTFLFGSANPASGYTFTTHHALGSPTLYYIVSN
jgi:prepilin-type N-terminal cleavage/methylation domain-containing protein